MSEQVNLLRCPACGSDLGRVRGDRLILVGDIGEEEDAGDGSVFVERDPQGAAFHTIIAPLDEAECTCICGAWFRLDELAREQER